VFVPKDYAAPSEDAVADLLRNHGLAEYVTHTGAGLVSSPIPFVFKPELGEFGTLQGHVDLLNPQWRAPVSGDALVIIHGPDGYISPAWYEAGNSKVVPTWNMVIAHVYGQVVIHSDIEWVRMNVTDLVDKHEALQGTGWAMSDADPDYVNRLLPAIVGVEMVISRIEAKFKLSQDKPASVHASALAALAAAGEIELAAQMSQTGCSHRD